MNKKESLNKLAGEFPTPFLALIFESELKFFNLRKILIKGVFLKEVFQ